MTVAFDFDGVIHRYSKGWQDGSIYDPPIEGALEGVKATMAVEPTFIFSSRAPGQIVNWLIGYGLDATDDDSCPACPVIGTPDPACRICYGSGEVKFWNTTGLLLVTQKKLAARIYVDDRAYPFKNWPETLAALNTRR